ncbi:CPBP family intramembrane metalloprotease [Brevibacillus invocatus]|uniref:CPBP family intramembrane metalloprotease n=1 Tax=Brevibacillus invocatus TaxID=173959 RepID=A0A3M8C9C2_9BACL|nr:type II CAAX endopeptidase family protein [Brevibacillus invocatus]RNB72268.1 CPBP family intramembrane metalloprotease [Brevibacillus invocatus]
MSRKRSLLLLIGYGFAATLAIFYGLVERQSLFVTFVSFHLLVCLGIPLLHGWWEGSLRSSWQQAWGHYERRGTRFGLVLGAMLMIGGLAGIWLLLQTPGRAEDIRSVLEHWGLDAQWIWWFSIYLVVINSLLEELLWRGFVLQRLLHVMTFPAAILLTSFFFSLYHLIITSVLFGVLWGSLMTLLVFGVGVLWSWMKGLFPSVYPTWLSHMLADVGLVAGVILWVYR